MRRTGDGAIVDAATMRPDETVHGWLRRVTRPWHDGVEAAFAPLDLATQDGLGRFLAAQALAVLPLERALEAAGAAVLLPDWPERRRSAALLADLGVLGVPVPSGLAPVPLGSRPEVLGGLYVLEGSRLGGRVLLRRVEASPDARVRSAGAFLGHHRPGAWARFLAVLDATAPIPDTLAGLREGARSAFALFRAAAALDPTPTSPARGSRLVHFTDA